MTTMEDLTKTQIVLLTLLVSFITSIATGIITTSLLAEAPQGITQTIDRVVERTIERVSTAPSGGGAIVKEVTIVKEGDAIASSIESASKAIVRIKSPVAGDGIEHFYALGVIVDKQGHVLSDKREIIQNVAYTIIFSDGSTFPAILTKVGENGSMALFKIQADDTRLRSLTAIIFSKVDRKLGQTVIAIEGIDKIEIAVGRVLSLDTSLGSAMTDILPAKEVQGGALLNLSGELVGLKTSNADLTLPTSSYTVVSPLSKFIVGL